jgi:peptidoglycan/LPS O-acetylase OafA/YrhL
VPQRYVALDGLRGIAAIFVVIYHMGAIESPSWPFSSAYLAVDLFFVLSGFVLSHAYGSRLAEGMTFSRFMARRGARLYPAYAAGLLLGTAAWFMTAQKILIDRFWIAVVTGFLLIPLPVRLSREPPIFPLDGPAWSLFLEFVVNIAFAAFYARLDRRVLAAVILISAAVLVMLAGSFGSLNLGWDLPNFWGGFPRASFSFFAGVLLHRVRPDGLRRFGAIILCLGIAALILPVPAEHHAIFDLGFVLILAPATVAAGAGLRLSGVAARTAEVLGEISYPLYITHVPLVIVLKSVSQDWTPLQTCLGYGLALVFLVIGAWLLARFYERPVRRYLESYRAGANMRLRPQA